MGRQDGEAHPAYRRHLSATSTFQVARDLGREYLEKLAGQRVMQVQSATDTPKKSALGERAVMVDGAASGHLRQGSGQASRRDPRAENTRVGAERARCSRLRPALSVSHG